METGEKREEPVGTGGKWPNTRGRGRGGINVLISLSRRYAS